MKEETLINLIRQILPESSAYIGDDTAYIAEKDLILTQDTLIEDVHFRLSTTTSYYLGRKAIAVNLSDIAAAGGVPGYILISLSMPKNIGESFVKEFYQGVHSICKEYNVVVVGGDLTAASKLTISVSVIGFANALPPANRRNAKPGDIVILVGDCGASSVGLYILEKKLKEPEGLTNKFIQAHINPVPLVKEGRKILETVKTPAMMDTSDGLADALYKICVLSNVEMEIDFSEVPYDRDISKILPDENSLRGSVLFGGEDYALLAAIPANLYEKLRQEVPIKKIGVVKKLEAEPVAYVKFPDGKKLKLNDETINNSDFFFKHFE